MRDAFLPYCRPDVGDAEIEAVASSMRNGWLTTGPQTAAFERAFAQASGVPYAVALNSCTAGIHVVLAALGVGPGDEVVMPSLTFAAGAQCTLELGAIPVFCDVEADTFSASVRTIAAVVTRRTKVIVAMPYGGRPQNVSEIVAYARERGIAIIEDAAHAAGMLDRGKWSGVLSDAAIYSFYATKNLATGEGGMLVTHDEALADRVRRLSLHGMSRDAWKRYTDRGSWRYDILEPGYKYNISDLASSIGLVQLERLPEMQARRDAIARRYMERLSGLAGLGFQRACDDRSDRHSWCMFAVTLDPEAGIERDTFIDAMREQNIGTSVHYIPTHLFTAYRDLPRRELPNTEVLGARLVSLPLYPTMTDRDVDDVVDAVHAVYSRELKPVPS
ncbi:MAG TPA: DegT/DnrJ/EryC1/StrS aminotransferase family protein [Candidatus Baltobacteraceae bacterium]|jgi:dTDP-4-amino-4,6-dideoxygalactose transaminase